jgi:hypothetical protein
MLAVAEEGDVHGEIGKENIGRGTHGLILS